MKKTPTIFLAALFAGAAFAQPVSAAETYVAVAANFTAAAKEIAAAFEKETGDKVVLSFGSTGQLHAQILNGAPFEIFLAADAKHPEALEKDGQIGSEPRFTYAVGKLALWSAKPGVIDEDGKILAKGDFDKVAVANPKTAPYGAAAMETIEKMGLSDALKPKLVFGQNVSQTHQFIASGAATIGFVALAQIVKDDSGSKWIVPETLYSPIRQQAVLLKKGDGNPAAKTFVSFLKGPAAAEIIDRYGYGTEKPGS